MIPIVLTAYNRLDTLKKTLDSLFRCDGIDKHNIYFFSDGGKDEADWEKVFAVRGYLQNQDLFVVEWNKNLGLRGNALDAIGWMFHTEEYDKIIFLQDDMEFSKDFLTFMDAALERFEDRKDIMFVSGYSHITWGACYLSPLIADGLGIWKSKWFAPYKYRTYFFDEFAKYTTPSFASYLKDILSGRSDAFMASLAYQMFISKSRCLHPSMNKIRYCVSDSVNSKKKDAKKLNNNLYEGFSNMLDETEIPYEIIKKTKNYKWSLFKKFTRWMCG